MIIVYPKEASSEQCLSRLAHASCDLVTVTSVFLSQKRPLYFGDFVNDKDGSAST